MAGIHDKKLLKSFSNEELNNKHKIMPQAQLNKPNSLGYESDSAMTYSPTNLDTNDTSQGNSARKKGTRAAAVDFVFNTIEIKDEMNKKKRSSLSVFSSDLFYLFLDRDRRGVCLFVFSNFVFLSGLTFVSLIFSLLFRGGIFIFLLF